MSQMIYKICPRNMWEEAVAKGVFEGAPIDLSDGFIHFSTGDQLRETAARHFARQDDLVLIAVDDAHLGPDLVYEVSRGGDLFPHLYAPLETAIVAWVTPLPLGPEGAHIFPEFEK
jgi:uncharacterized protein (DUF952 family)